MVVHRYKKGANAERELAKILSANGFAVIRAARSGGSISTPDIVAVKKRLVVAFECKTWKRKPKLKKEEAKEFLDWCDKGGTNGFLAWRHKGKWLLLNVKKLKDKDIKIDGIGLKEFLGLK